MLKWKLKMGSDRARGGTDYEETRDQMKCYVPTHDAKIMTAAPIGPEYGSSLSDNALVSVR